MGRPNLNLKCSLYLVDSRGKRKLLKTLRRDPFVRQLIDCIYSHLTSLNQSVQDITNTTRTWNQTTTYATAAVGDAARGIVVGTGSNAVTIGDYCLQTKISHGTGSGHLYHCACTVTAPTKSGSTYTTEVYRQFINFSGGSITVEEIGIYGFWSPYYFLFARDTTGSIAVPDGAMLAVIYNFQTTV